MLDARCPDDADVPAARGLLRSLNLQHNKINADHAICGESRVDARNQKGATASELKKAEIAKASAAGKKVYVPKWLRK